MNSYNTLTTKIIYTLLILTLARLGIFIPVPGVDHETFIHNVSQNTLINFLNTFSGGGLSTIGIFALGIVPYINASIIVQLLIKIVPDLERLQKEEGESGRQKIMQVTRYLTFIWAIAQSTAISLWIKPYVFDWNIQFIFDCIVTLTTGSIIIMWLSELITEYGLGNGASLLIFQNIVSGIPKNINNSAMDLKEIFLFLFLFLVMLSLTVIIQEGTKKIKIISAKQLSKNQQISPKSYIPLKINQGGVMPIVFASAFMTIPNYIETAVNNVKLKYLINLFTPNNPLHLVLYCILILIFSYLYTSIVLNPDDVAENLKKMGASIPNVRPGKNTSKYLYTILNRLTLLGSFFLFFVAVVPSILSYFIKLQPLQGLGITSLLILVGVAIDTAKQIQTYIISEKYNNMIQ
uniref:Protein translocase subunit SecY n=1 Tax=Neogoniolithon spectabile TaxID=231755 RepID=A0A3G3MGR3_9FLOR|nr:preprotein translocase subunit SecY [Neogoniolithon spectabile]AYR06020.1 preprotein translocase subunit SecY [Neogoniolithon spectabile]